MKSSDCDNNMLPKDAMYRDI